MIVRDRAPARRRPRLALAVAYQESGLEPAAGLRGQRHRRHAGHPHRRASGPRAWSGAGSTCSRRQDNVTAGVVILRALDALGTGPHREGRRRPTTRAWRRAEARHVRRHQGLRAQRHGAPCARCHVMRGQCGDRGRVPDDLTYTPAVSSVRRRAHRARARRPLRASVAHRRRRDGDRLPGRRRAARPRRRAEGHAPATWCTTRRSSRRFSREAALGAPGSPTPASSPVFDQGEDDGDDVPRHGVRARPDAARGHAGGGAADARGPPSTSSSRYCTRSARRTAPA